MLLEQFKLILIAHYNGKNHFQPNVFFLSVKVFDFGCAFWEFPAKCLIYIIFWMSFPLRNLGTHLRHEKKNLVNFEGKKKNTITKGHVINICTHDDLFLLFSPLFFSSFLFEVLTKYLIVTLRPLNSETWENQTITEQIKVRFSFFVCFRSSDNN